MKIKQLLEFRNNKHMAPPRTNKKLNATQTTDIL